MHVYVQTHRAVSLSRHKKFSSWVDCWLDNSVTDDDIQSCVDFLLGRGCGDGDTVETEREMVLASDDRPPYHDYQRYHVTRRQQPQLM